MLREEQHVAAARAQRRQRQVDHVDPVIQILAKPLVLDHVLELAVGGREQANIDGDLGLGADRADLALLQRAQELGLELDRHLADLVEEQRAAVGLLEQALPALLGVGERALGVAEQLALEQLLGGPPRS